MVDGLYFEQQDLAAITARSTPSTTSAVNFY